MSEPLPTVALSIQQPWAWLIVNGHKDVENRSWRTRFRGPVLIHAGARADRDAMADFREGYHPVTGAQTLFGLPGRPEEWIALHEGRLCGGIVGVAEIHDCVEASASAWFVGRYGFLIRNARPLPFRPCKGALGFFQVRP